LPSKFCISGIAPASVLRRRWQCNSAMSFSATPQAHSSRWSEGVVSPLGSNHKGITVERSGVGQLRQGCHYLSRHCLYLTQRLVDHGRYSVLFSPSQVRFIIPFRNNMQGQTVKRSKITEAGDCLIANRTSNWPRMLYHCLPLSLSLSDMSAPHFLHCMIMEPCALTGTDPD